MSSRRSFRPDPRPVITMIDHFAEIERVRQQARRATPPVCPLCTSAASSDVWAVTADSVFSRLKRQWDTDFTEDAFPFGKGTEFVLHECVSCGLHFFNPEFAGNAAFYQQLMTSVPYEPSRWEFEQVAHELKASDSVVDFGCGEGAYLRMMQPLVCRAIGVDHNRDAIERLRQAGVEAEVASFSRFAAEHPWEFDVACAFQTLEHLADIDEFMRAITHCVRPGGRIFLSVPNRGRFARDNNEPLDCPPHHVSRWADAQLLFLADRFGLDLAEVRFEQPDLSHIKLRHHQRIERRVGRLLGRPAPRPVWRASTKLVIGPVRYSLLARHSLYSRRGIYGHTMLAQFRVPPVV